MNANIAEVQSTEFKVQVQRTNFAGVSLTTDPDFELWTFNFELMELISLSAISPIDGRYRKQVQHLDEYFSEYALMKYRVLIETE